MRKRMLILLAAGLLVVLAIVIRISPREPIYDGESLSYWMAHWYRGMYGGQALVDPSAKAAVREAGTNALPFLIKWMETPARSSSEVNYPSWALHGFEVLGSTAKAAVPDLVALLGRSGNYPSL